MTDLPDIRIKALVSFPPNALGGTGIEVNKTNGTFVIDLDYSEFAFSGTLPPNTNTLVWDPLTNVYMLVPPSAVGGISDAPSDNKLYGRKNTAWTEVVLGAGSGDVVGPASAVNNNFAAFDTTTGKLIKDSGVPTSGPVRYDTPQTLTEPQQAQARKNVYAAPFDALAYNGMQINGSMDVSQELGDGGSSLNSAVIADNWRLYYAGTSLAVTSSRGTFSIVPGFRSLIGIGVTTAKAVLADGDVVQLYQSIEGYRIYRLGWGTASAKPITIGFWCMHARTGTYSVVIGNGGTRSYAATYTQNVSNVAEYKTITVPGDTSGTWNTGNTTGMNIVFPMAASGAIVASSANTWLAGSFNAAPGQVNGIAATSDNFRLTGVVVLPGIEAPTAAQSPLIMRPYDQELLTCQRYWKKNADALGHWHETSPTQAYFSIQHEPPMRAAPTVTVLATANRIYRPSVAGYNIGDNTGGGTAESTWINLNTATAVANVPAQLIPDTLSFDARL